MDEERQGQHEPKISTVEILLIGIVFVVFDVIGMVILLVAMDDFFILDILSLPIFLYLYLKGVSPMRQAMANLVEAVPYLGAMPLYTLGWIFTILLDRNQNSMLAKAATTAVAAKASANRVSGKNKLQKTPARGAGYEQLESAERTDMQSADRTPGYSKQSSASSGDAYSRADAEAEGGETEDGRSLAEMAGEDKDVFETLQKESFDPDRALVANDNESQGMRGPYVDGNTVDLGGEEAA